MSGTPPILSPTPVSANSLSVPPDSARPSSASSSRSNSSRKGRQGRRSNNQSSGASRSGSHASHGRDPSRGGQGDAGENRQKGNNRGQGQKTNGQRSSPAPGQSSRSRKPTPVNIGDGGAQRAAESVTSPEPSTSPRSIHTKPSVPKTALEAAMEAAEKKYSGGALASLKSLISDLKTMPPANPNASNGGPSPGTSRAQSNSTAVEVPTLQKQERKTSATAPVAIPTNASSKSPNKLKPDAPSFTPSLSPTSGLSASPNVAKSNPSGSQPPSARPSSTNAGPAQDRRFSSSSTAASSFASMPSPPSLYANALPHFPLASLGYQNPLAAHADPTGEAFQGMYDPQFQQHQQLLAQQQLQFQQVQLLQAQLQAAQLAAQQQQTAPAPQMGSFIAPRFQALAQQRAAAQQQQAAAQLLQAQQIFELQQQQLYQMQEAAQAKAVAEATLRNPPPVFEEDESPPPQHASLGPTGRPQLAPSFTFGAKRRESITERAATSPAPSPITVDRSAGIGGAAATGLAGLAARAHKRTGSELTPAMQQQLEIQREIEALQAKQKALMQQELASQGSTALSQITSALSKPSGSSSQPVARHRRVQSTVPSATVNDSFAAAMDNIDLIEPLKATAAASSATAMLPPPVPSVTGHSRRHSMNVFAKGAGSGVGFGGGAVADIPEDGFPASSLGGMGHHRSGSRSGFESGSWRSTSQLQGGNINASVSDLAAAQAQLQSLAQFRAQAGGGHAKMASFSFPNMLPNLMAATTLSTPAGQSLWQQQQAFQMQLQQTAQGPQRKNLFAPYLPQASLPPLLQAGKLVVGILRVNKKNRSDAYVATDVLDADIYICGSKDRNRALEGDIVAVELLDVDEVWNAKRDKEEKKRKKEENASYDLKPSVAKKLEKKKDDVEVEGQGLMLFEDEEVNDDTKPTYAGHVVAVVERMPGQLFSGQLGVLRPSSAATKEKQELERRERDGDRATQKRDEQEARPKIVWFKPTDKRVPLIAIPTEQAPGDFVEHPDKYADRLFVATIKRWPITSLHPFGTLVEELGPIGDVETETSALLKDCNFPTEDFAEPALKCLPPMPWTIPEREYEIREDLRQDRVFTIDPPTAKDLDDALSVKGNGDDTYTVGVHIADVSYFVKANTALEREARKRATSVYLVQRAVPMLPPQLSEELCSLVPSVDRLAFSAFFTIDKDANIVNKRFARTIIKSCAKLSYADALAVVDGGSVDKAKLDEAVTEADIANDIRILHDLSQRLRTKRIDSGAMVANNRIKISFDLDESGRPVDVQPYRKNDANSLVEEFMILANTSVAQLIANGLPEQSLLRRHEPPIERRMDAFVARAKKLGYNMDASSAGTLQRSFDAINDEDAALCMELRKRKAVLRARYFCTGMLDIAKYSHWALNAPLYTHFTSPIRRYADVLVHRMLDACIASPNANDVKFIMDRDQVAKCAQQCNTKRAGAKLAEEQSVHLHLCMLIHDLTEKHGPVVREARVIGVLDAAFDVVVPEFGIEKRVHVDKMPLKNSVYDEHADKLSLYWTKTDVLSYLAATDDDPHLLKIRDLARARSKGDLTPNGLAGSGTPASKQLEKSSRPTPPKFEGLRQTDGGHFIQDIKELMPVPVIVTADMTKSPPVLVVYACNPYAE